ncbi:MAG TPA: hypothetical protein DCP85_10510, partial [Elusimicrobia bacterium]|nr:hypothetical protein [Elusimicrobiota bacterium]
SKVEFYVDGSLKATDTSSPYSYSLNTTQLSNGSHALLAKAYDAAGNIGQSAQVSVTVANTVIIGAGPYSLWDNSVTPALASEYDSAALELGLRFMSAVPGSVQGLRFYKGSSNTGSHSGHLWTNSGTLLGSVTFAGETASGWQQASFPTPIAINSDTQYVISYHTDVGFYAKDAAYFAAGPYVRYPLQGINSVFIYSAAPAFPTQTFDSTNYWVDVVFNAADLTAPAAPSNVTLSSPTVSSLNLAWSASTDNVGVAGYKLDVSLNSAFSSFVTGYNNKDLGNVASTAITGLSAGTAYYARLRAYDAAGNTSANSAAAAGATSAAAGGNTYYVDASAANDSGNGSSSSPKKYIASGISLLSSGDTLIIKDGTYTGANNMIGDYASPQVWPPSGTAGNPTTIKAEHMGMAVLDGQLNYPAFSNNNRNYPSGKINYLHIDGIVFRNGSGGAFSLMGDYNKVTHCGFMTGGSADGYPAGEYPIASIAGGSSYSLVEDCWVWGKGRYGFYTSSINGGTNRIIFRRIIVRLDSTPTGVMTAGLRFYNSSSNIMQNCVVIDGNINPGSGSPEAIATGGGSSSGESNHLFLGNIVLNNPNMVGFCPEKLKTAATFSHNVLWGGVNGFQQTQDWVTPAVLTLSNLTIGNNNFNTQTAWGADSAHAGIGLRGNYSGTINLSNSIIQVPNASTAFYNGPTQASNSHVYLASGGGLGSGYPVSGYASFNNATQTTLNNAGLKYLPRTEPNSTLANAGIGTNILYQYGGSGTFYGDAGWNVASTSDPLWPYPNEQFWAAKMAAYNGAGANGNRGFAALASQSSTPLTDYIWTYLGNPKPDIYGGAVVDTQAPGAPTALSLGGATSSSLNLTWTAATDNMAVNGYKLDVSPNAAFSSFVTGYSAKDLGNVTSASITGLSAGTAYYARLRAYDAAGNTSSNSASASGTTAPVDATAPGAPGNLAAAALNSTSIGLSWSAATDNAGVTGYKLDVSLNSAFSSFVTGYNNKELGNVTSTSITGLSAGTVYYARLRAYDAAGNVSANSAPASAATLSQSSSITMGETNILGIDDSGNGNLLMTQSATLAQTGTIQSLSFYVTQASGKLRMGVYDATGPGGGPGAKKAETNEITPVAGWNTAGVITPVSLPAGAYWLAYLSNDNNLHFRKHGTAGSFRYYAYAYGTLPATYSATPTTGADHWSFYATLDAGAADTAAPSAPSNAALNNPAASSLSLAWSASTDNVGVTGYRLDVSLNSAFSSFVTGYQNKDLGNVTSASITGLSASTAYYARLRAYDAAGNASANSAAASATTSAAPDATAPTAAITAPANGATVSGTLAVSASASDNVGVSKVEFYMDGSLKATDTASPYAYSLDTTQLSNGSHALLAKAHDAAGNVGQSAQVSVTVANTVPDTTAPSAPANPALGSPAASSLSLSW